MNLNFNWQEIATSFMVLFAVIDITGSIPVLVGLTNEGKKVHALKAAGYSLLILVLFLFAGEALLNFFHIDIPSFAVAGSLVLFALALEMTFNIEIFKNDGPDTSQATLVPVVFPLIAGPGTLTTELSLRAEFSVENIIVAVLLNMIFVWLIIRNIFRVEKIFGKNTVYILRRFFGVILLAMSVKLFASNIQCLLG